MPKNLVLCCDGTWDSADQQADPKTGEICVSNVLKVAVRMKKVTGAGKLQIVYYDQGVGTGNLVDKIGGGAFGDGLEANINDVYRFSSRTTSRATRSTSSASAAARTPRGASPA